MKGASCYRFLRIHILIDVCYFTDVAVCYAWSWMPSCLLYLLRQDAACLLLVVRLYFSLFLEVYFFKKCFPVLPLLHFLFVYFIIHRRMCVSASPIAGFKYSLYVIFTSAVSLSSCSSYMYIYFPDYYKIRV